MELLCLHSILGFVCVCADFSAKVYVLREARKDIVKRARLDKKWRGRRQTLLQSQPSALPRAG